MMKFGKFLLSLLTATVLGTAAVPVYAEDSSNGSYLHSSTGEASEQAWKMDGNIAVLDKSDIALLEKVDSLSLISTVAYDLDEEYAAEIKDYKLNPSSAMTRAVSKSVKYARSWKIYRKSDNAVMVQWVLTGEFTYDGKTSKCKNMTYSNKASGTYNVTSNSHYPSQHYAIGNCGAVNKKTGKSYSKVIKFGVTKTGILVTG